MLHLLGLQCYRPTVLQVYCHGALEEVPSVGVGLNTTGVDAMEVENGSLEDHLYKQVVFHHSTTLRVAWSAAPL